MLLFSVNVKPRRGYRTEYCKDEYYYSRQIDHQRGKIIHVSMESTTDYILRRSNMFVENRTEGSIRSGGALCCSIALPPAHYYDYKVDAITLMLKG